MRYITTRADIGVDYHFHKSTTLTFYFGYAAGGNIIKSLYKSSEATFGYLEVSHRF